MSIPTPGLCPPPWPLDFFSPVADGEDDALLLMLLGKEDVFCIVVAQALRDTLGWRFSANDLDDLSSCAGEPPREVDQVLCPLLATCKRFRTCACIPHPLKLREAYGIAAETDEFGVTWPLPDTPLERVSWQYYTQYYEVPIAPQLRKAIEQLATRMQDKEMAARAQYQKAYDHLWRIGCEAIAIEDSVSEDCGASWDGRAIMLNASVASLNYIIDRFPNSSYIKRYLVDSGRWLGLPFAPLWGQPGCDWWSGVTVSTTVSAPVSRERQSHKL